MPNLFSRLMSKGADKQLKEFRKIADQVNDQEQTFHAMDDEELRSQTARFRERYDNGEPLDDILPEAFAAMREASSRTLGMRHFDVQVIGGIALHRGMIAEMKTGEGKTLVSTLAGYLNAISGKGVHIVTVNDYLAKRDSQWMGQVYRFMGMDVGLLQNGMRLPDKKPAYSADVTYGTNSEFGFDYLRDNMVTRADMRVQRGHNFAIVDEVDSILIDEARTPLIISGAGTKSASTYKDFARAVRGLKPDVDFEMDEAKHTIAATDTGLKKIERALGIDDIYADMSGQLVNHLQQALKAQYMFHRDQQYVVADGEVKIVDEFTGRIMEGRRYSEGLHQAIEAKEGVLIREENQTLATITLQNYFRLYDKLSGMTGTAMTEDAEFREIYNLPVQAIPPNKPVIRVDHDDLVYKTVDAKFNAVADDVVARHEKGQPVLVGTVSIENSEKLSRILDKRGIKHQVLNAKFHEREAQIVAQAGREGAVTIATNMAGRGTDILLGGNPQFLASDLLARDGVDPEEATPEQREAALDEAKETCEREKEHVLAAGGLCVIGTERHESRRIDNQLRGRSGRQGDPGETQFYLSLEDNLMRLFGGERMDRIASMMDKYDMPDDMPIQAKIVTKAVESAQRKVEQINFSMRKNVLDYDDVMNKQRQVIYEERNKILDGKDLVAHVEEVTLDTVQRRVAEFCPEDGDPETWDFKGLSKWLQELTGRTDGPAANEDMEQGDIVDAIDEYVVSCYHEKSERLSDEIMQQLSAQVMLRVIDTRWMSYLQEMDYLKTGIGLRGFGQRDPLVEYKTEAFAAFTELVNTMYEDFLRTILRIELAVAPQQPEDDGLRGAHYSGPEEVDGDHGNRRAPSHLKAAGQGGGTPAPSKPMTYRKSEDPDPYVGVGRNDPCPCGSGKKFKNCHGRNR
ncbi:preprotein translocase subunit SecA [Olsenella porci]|jgi:preprotein translocase subunit SecA|uniref:Protein translocase subunit SecA n=1 Tax=Olsenella porci TaxID=2652279 RepID=A0A6N7XF82_9ACTN|nr:preprotein translocase subunit SecA [Olsenella porci]MST72983.1 preprotein translocase subunit SecA [Olsenella porci]